MVSPDAYNLTETTGTFLKLSSNRVTRDKERRLLHAHTHILNLLKKESKREKGKKNRVKWGRRLICRSCYEKYQLQLHRTGMENRVIRYAPVLK